jgi:hypothetical protein
MSRIQALLTAGALTGLVLVTLFWWGRSHSEAAAVTPHTSIMTEPIVTPSGAPSPDLQQLLNQNQQLRETIETLVAREAEYQQQIAAANQQILSANAQQIIPASGGAAAGGAAARAGYASEEEESDHYEDEVHEHEKDEHEEDD